MAQNHWETNHWETNHWHINHWAEFVALVIGKRHMMLLGVGRILIPFVLLGKAFLLFLN